MSYSLLITNEGINNLTSEEEYILCLESQKGDQQATEKLLRSNLKFVAHKVHRMLGSLENPDLFNDAISAGIEGFMMGLKKYKPSLGTRLLTYVGYWIEERIRQFLYKKNLINKPVYKQKRKYRNEHLAEPIINIQEYETPTSASYTDTCEDQSRLKQIMQSINVKYKFILLHHFDFLGSHVTKSEVCYLLNIKNFEYSSVIEFVIKDCINPLDE